MTAHRTFVVRDGAEGPDGPRSYGARCSARVTVGGCGGTTARSRPLGDAVAFLVLELAGHEHEQEDEHPDPRPAQREEREQARADLADEDPGRAEHAEEEAEETRRQDA